MINKIFGLCGKLPPGKWYIVKFDLTDRDPLSRPIMNKKLELEINKWLQKQVKKKIIKCYDYDKFGRYVFIDEQDALLFKLRWK